MTQRFISSILVLVTLFFGIPAMPVSAEPGLLPVGMMTYVEGRVDRNTGDDYFPSIKEEPILPGDVIRTKTYSRAEIVFNDKSVLRIGENTQVKIQDYTLKNGKREKASLYVDRGKVRVIVSKSQTGATNFDILTPNSEGSVKGSDICVSYLKSSTSILALEGEIAAKSLDFPDKEIRVSGGQTAYVPFGAPPFGPRPFLKVEQKRFEAETSPAAQTPDESRIRKAIIAKFIGSVRVRNSGSEPWHMPGVKEAISSGAEIETGTDGKVQIVLESGRIINLKPNTHLKISRLSRDPKTGTLEDVLESKLGEIRAKIDKKKEGSRFEIHSPVAIAAVRGTILYFFIKQNSSTSFFEQGNGTLTNLIKKATIDIAAGKNGAVDSEGNTYGPADTSREVLDDISQGWEIDDETYGYTPPPGSDYIAPYEPQNPEGEQGLGGDSNPYDDIKPEILGQPVEQVLEELALNIFGIWGGESNENSLYSQEEGSFFFRGEDFGFITAQTFPWAVTQPFLVIGGLFSDSSEGQRPLLFNTIITSEVPDFGTGQATSDGGAFWGYTAGLWSGVEGTLAALFVDPQKNVGVFTGDVNGVVDNTNGVFAASGVIEPQTLGVFPDIDPAFFTDYFGYGYASSEYGLSGNFNGAGGLWANMNGGEIIFLTDESRSSFQSFDFGIYNFRFSNGFAVMPAGADSWNAVTGGYGSFGTFLNNSPYPNYDQGYWLAELGGSWMGGEIRGSMIGAFLTQTHLGVLGGGVSGLYEDTAGAGVPDFILQSVGSYQSLPLVFFNNFDGSLYDVDWNYDGYFSAYMGGVESILNDGGIVNAFVLGYLGFGESTADRHLFVTDVNSTNALLGGGMYEGVSKTTFDGGAYFGYVAGTRNFSDINAGFAGIYVGPGGEGGSAAGLITGPLNGEFFQDVDLFSAEGELATRQLDNVEILPEDAVDSHIYTTGGEGQLLGGFDGVETSGEIRGYDNFYTASFVAPNAYIPYVATWGIYYQTFGEGSFANYENAQTWSGFMGGYDPIGAFYSEGLTDDYGFWIADITDGVWESENFSAHLAGKFLTNTKLGTLEGDIFGLYSETGEGEGYWNGVGVGFWEGTSLGFAARIVETRSSDFARFDGESFNTFGSLSDSLIGGVGNLFETPHMLLMGNYEAQGNNQLPILWAVDIQSYSVFDINPVTFDGDGFYGFAGGRWAHGEINGGLRLLYIRNDGGVEMPSSAGIIGGDLNGRYFEFDSENALGMWYAEGDLSSQELGSTWITPQELNDIEYGAVEEHIFSGAGVGIFTAPGDLYTFVAASAIFANIEGQNDWGIFAAGLAGQYFFDSESPLVNEAFRTAFGGVGYGQYEGDYPMYIFGNVAGDFTDVTGDTGNVDAAINGIWISAQGTQQNEFVKVGTVTGDVFGDFTAAGSEGSWEATAVGEWVGVTELDPQKIGFDQIQQMLSSEIAIGELMNSIVPGGGDFNGAGSINGTMDFSVFTPFGLNDNGFWSAFFDGTFTGLPEGGSSFSASFNDGNVSADLFNGTWQDGHWLADVTGSAAGGVFSGQAGGTYTSNQNDPSSGTFSGVGVGTWSNGEGCQECV